MNDVIQKLIDSLDIKRVNVTLVDRSEVMKRLYALTFDDVKRDILYQKDKSENDTFEVVLPAVDEIKLKEYVVSQFSDQLFLPPNGCFTKLIPEIKKIPLGMLEVELNCFETHLNQSDNRYLKDRLSFSKSSYFIFNYEENVYSQVDSTQLEKAFFDLNKNNLEVDHIKNERVKDYVIRYQNLNAHKNKLKGLYLKESKNLYEMKNKKFGGGDRETIINFLLNWQDYFQDDFKKWLSMKYIFSIVDEDEYSLYKKLNSDISVMIKKSFYNLNEIKESLGSISVDMSSDETYQKYKYVTNTLSLLMSLTAERSDSAVNMQGYLLLKNEDGFNVVIESLIEIEKRNMLLDEKVTKEKIREEKETLTKQVSR